ncbi:MAG: hypothetical protein PF569_02270 [Candidatus Woesearchaeota archaeon]|jgi:hypothetical protein|nr:hypothetical protein [Candidatus Woesearchaeota archaeon]
MKIPICQCNLEGTPFSEESIMWVVGKFIKKDNITMIIIVNPKDGRLYEESSSYIKETYLTDIDNHYEKMIVKIRDKFQERYNQDTYILTGFNRQGMAILEDENGNNITAYVSRLLFVKFD